MAKKTLCSWLDNLRTKLDKYEFERLVIDTLVSGPTNSTSDSCIISDPFQCT